MIEYDNKSLIINSKRILLVGGEFHYFRVPNQLWEDKIKKMKSAGLNFVSIYIPWNWHEPEEGKYIWDGDRDLKKFLELCKKYELYVVIKPGPYICAEWDFGGFPHWLIPKNLKLRMLDFEYLNYVEKWYKKIYEITKPYLNNPIILIQVENEYDHFYEFTNFVKSKNEAIEYMLNLLKILKKVGFNLPFFTNEGRIIYGTEIINTFTYYPNIPWLWKWEFNDFDRKIEESRKLQPNAPLMIMELEAGWFSQFGIPDYYVEPELTSAISRTVIAYGASLINYYMFIGGTTFPYWGCRGDEPNNIGSCTTYDFGGAPVREWGELSEKFYLVKYFANFINTFQDLLINSETYNDKAQIIDIEKKVKIIGEVLSPDYENVKILTRLNKNSGFVMIRNLEDYEKNIKIKLKLDSEIIFPEKILIKLTPKSSYLLPINIKIPYRNLTIIYSTSELFTYKKIGNKIYILFSGKKGIDGEICYILDGKKRFINYKIQDYKKIKIKDDLIFLIIEEKLAQNLTIFKDSLIISDLYFIEDYKNNKIKAYVKEGKKQMALVISKQNEKKVFIDVPEEEPVKIEWLNNWRVKADSAEKEVNYNDEDWFLLKGPISLEDAGFFEHGWYWYRTYFELPQNFSNPELEFDTNGIDRSYIYINGKLLWKGIGSRKKSIENFVKPGKNLIAVRLENAYHTKSHPHEGPIQKRSGIQTPIKLFYIENNEKKFIELKDFKLRDNLSGLINGYHLFNYNDKSWFELEPAERYIFTETFGDLIWLRRKFYYKKKEKIETAIKITIPQASERLLIYVNGYPIGKYESIGPQNEFYVPEPYLKRENILAIILEGPGFHNVKESGFVPAVLNNPIISTYFYAKEKIIKI